MRKLYSQVAFALAVLVSLFFYQNCSDVQFSNKGSFKTAKTHGGSLTSGNGQGYDLKLDGKYAREIPGFTCDGELNPYETIEIRSSQITFIKNHKEACSAETRTLTSDALLVSPYFKDIIGYKDGAFRKVQASAEILRSQDATLEVWCRWQKNENEGMDFVVASNDTDSWQTSIFIGQQENTIYTRRDVAPFGVEREINSSQVTYLSQTASFRLVIDFKSGSKLESQLFMGHVDARIDEKDVQHPVICYSAGNLDRQAYDLKYEGRSDAEAPVQQRVFDETVSPAWKLEGKCNPNAGDVAVYGDGIPSRTVTTCRPSSDGGGQFSLDIHYDQLQGSVHFADAPGLYREILASQWSSKPIKTWVFKAHSSASVQFISTAAELQSIQTGIGAPVYILANDIDLATEVGPTNNWNPIGSSLIDSFSSVFEGNHKVISNLDLSTSNDYVGLFGYATNAIIQGISVEQAFVRANSDYVGGIVGFLRFSTLRRAHFSGQIDGVGDYSGGLVGYAWDSRILDSSATGIVRGNNYVGGLTGAFRGDLISRSSSSSSVVSQGGQSVGGIVGMWLDHPGSNSIENSYAAGPISGSMNVGGLVGSLTAGSNGGSMTNSYSSSTVDCASASSLCGGPILGGSPLLLFRFNDVIFVEEKCTNCTRSVGVPVPLSEMMMPVHFSEWDFYSPTWTFDAESKMPVNAD